MECSWCRAPIERDAPREVNYCSKECSVSANRMRTWCNRKGIKVIMPRDQKQYELYQYNVWMTHQWSTNDVNVMDPDIRERIKELRANGGNLWEIAAAIDNPGISVETVRSVLEHEI